MAKNIHIRHMLAFLQDNYTTVSVKFLNDIGIISGSKDYTYKVLLEDNIKEGDTCVVDVSGVKKLVVVTAVHSTPKIDPSAQYDFKWIVQRIDTSRYDQQVAVEEKVRDMFFEIERENQRKKFVDEFKTGLEGRPLELFNEAVALINSTKVIENGSQNQ